MNPFEPESILCGVDFSPASQAALGYTALLARAYGAQIQVLHSQHLELPEYLDHSHLAALTRELQEAEVSVEQRLREFAAPALADLAGTADYLAVDEPPVDGLLQAVSEGHPGLVVLGSRGGRTSGRSRLGGVAAEVLREITVPLLVARQGAQAPTPPKIEHILCPVNYTKTAAAGLRAAASLAQRLGAGLTVLHSLEGDGDVQNAREALCDWVPEEVKAHCQWQAAPVLRGPAAERIVEAAEEMAADLIVVGGRRRALLAATILGATTERVVRHAACSVLTVVAS